MAEKFMLLGVDFGKLSEEYNLKTSVYAYLLIIAFSVASLPLGFAMGYYQTASPLLAQKITILTAALTLASIPLSALASFGFICLGYRWRSKLLAYAALILLIIGVLYSIIPLASEMVFIMTLKSNTLLDLVSYVGGSLLIGASGIIFGTALWKASKDWIVRATAALNVITGLLALTIILALVSVLIQIPVMLLEAHILYREHKRKTVPE